MQFENNALWHNFCEPSKIESLKRNIIRQKIDSEDYAFCTQNDSVYSFIRGTAPSKDDRGGAEGTKACLSCKCYI